MQIIEDMEFLTELEGKIRVRNPAEAHEKYVKDFIAKNVRAMEVDFATGIYTGAKIGSVKAALDRAIGTLDARPVRTIKYGDDRLFLYNPAGDLPAA